MAGSTGVEPATSGLTVQGTNQAARRPRAENLHVYATAVKRGMPSCARKCAREPPGDLPKVLRAHDVIAVEDAPALVARDLHGHPVGNPCVDHVSDGRAPEVVAQHPRHTSLPARRHPGYPKVLPTLSGQPPLQVREEVRDDPSDLALERPYAL